MTGEIGRSVYCVQFEYEVNGTKYRRTKMTGVPMQTGDAITIQYDPCNPLRILDAAQVLRWRDPRKWLAMTIGAAITIAILYLEFHH